MSTLGGPPPEALLGVRRRSLIVGGRGTVPSRQDPKRSLPKMEISADRAARYFIR